MMRERAYRVRCAQRSAIVYEWHRHEVVAEDASAQPDQRQDTNQLAASVARTEIHRLVAEYLFYELAPAVQMKVRRCRVATYERIPLRGSTAILLDNHGDDA